MKKYLSNEERTQKYLENFNREKTLRYLLDNNEATIFDVGANDGNTALEFKEWWPGSKIHCFEPQEECWKSLTKLKEKYPQGEIVINNQAIGNESNKKVTFYTHDISSGLSGFNKINTNSIDSVYLDELSKSNNVENETYFDSINNKRSVEIIRLEDYMYQNNIQHINLLKIDTQGHEPEVIEGLGEMLSKVDIIISELMFYDYYEKTLSFFDLEKFLIPAGFKLYDINHIAKNPMNGRTDWVDVIYVNERLRMEKKNAQR